MANLYKSINIQGEGSRNGEYLPFLDGLRGVAILLVLGCHFFARSQLLSLGWIGVNMFFILSGYLITGKLIGYDHSGGKGYFKNFYIRRILRIFPLYYGCLIFFFLILPFFYKHYDLNFSGLYRSQLWFWLFLDNWKIVFHGFPSNITLNVYWSLAVEEQFYLIWPVLLWYVKGRKLKITMGFLIAVSIMTRIFTGAPYKAYFSTLTAFEPLLMGAFICLLEREGKLTGYYKYILGAALAALPVLGIVFLFNGNTGINNAYLIRYGYTAIDCIMAFLLWCSLLNYKESLGLRGVFSARWLVWLGKYSFGIYMYHMMFLETWVVKGEKDLLLKGMQPDMAYLFTRIVGLVVVLAGSYASYHLYEKHFLRLKKYFV